MKRSYSIATGIALTLLATSALAAPLAIVNGDGTKPLAATNGHYAYESEAAEMISGVQITRAELPATITAIDYRYGTTVAVGQDGPWTELSSLRKSSAWQPLPYPKDQPSFLLKLPEAPAAELPPKADILKAAHALPKEEAARWQPIVKKCDGGPSSPCYTYHNTDDIRLTLSNGQEVLLTISYPGGC